MDWRTFFSIIISGWMDGWVFLHQFGWMIFFSIILDGCSRLLPCVRCSLSLSLLPLLSGLCMAVHCRDFIFCNVFDASLPKICHCLLLFVAVFFSPHPLFSFCSKILICFRFGAAIVGGLFCQFLERSGERTTRVLCCCKGRTATTRWTRTRRTRRTMYIVLSLSPTCEELLLFRSKLVKDDESGGKQVRWRTKSCGVVSSAAVMTQTSDIAADYCIAVSRRSGSDFLVSVWVEAAAAAVVVVVGTLSSVGGGSSVVEKAVNGNYER